MSATVTKFARNRFATTGEIAVIGGRLVREAYERVHTTLRAAELDAAALDRQNAEALAELEVARAARAEASRAYLAARAARAAVPQASFDF